MACRGSERPLIGAAVLLLFGMATARAEEDCTAERPPGTPSVTPALSTDEMFHAPYLHFTSSGTGKVSGLMIWGAVCEGDAARVASYFERNPPSAQVTFLSPGGVLEDGLAIGRTLGALHTTTRIEANAICASGCNFMFLGGRVRIVEPGGKFMVHMFSYRHGSLHEMINEKLALAHRLAEKYRAEHSGEDNNGIEDAAREEAFDAVEEFIQTKDAKEAADIARFLTEMQLSLRFLTTFANIPVDKIRPLTRKKLQDFNVGSVD